MVRQAGFAVKCTECGSDNSDDRRFCAGCGASLAVPCAACGFRNAPDARFCGGCGAALAAAPPEPAGAAQDDSEIRPAVILFADICGFTELSAGLGAEATHALLGRFFEAVDGEIVRHGGTIDKHIGDCVMAVFGAPVAHRDDPERAVRAALRIPELAAEIGAAQGLALRVHTGLAAGRVVAGATHGSDATVTGESVNLAARLLEAAGPGETLISETVYRSLAGRLEVAKAEEVRAKGFDRPVKTWRVSGFRSAADDTGPFVGRRAELAAMEGALTTCLETRTGTTLYVRGEPGIGKTRLVEELRRIAAARGLSRHTGLVLDFGAGAGQDAVRSLVASLLGAAPGDDEAGRSAVARAVAERRVETAGEIFLNDLLGLPQSAANAALLDAMDSDARHAGRRRTIVELVRGESGRRPALLSVEDLHWADAETLTALTAICATVRDCPAILVMTSRIEGDPIDAAWRGRAAPGTLTTIDLGPLRNDEAAALAAKLADPDPEIVSACIERADGNPLFLEQLLRSAGAAGAAEVPDSVQAVVLARADRLPPAERHALQAASVLGQRFPLDALRHLIDAPAYGCDALIAHHLIRPDGDRLLFHHALIRDGVYASLLTARRVALHRKAAEWYAGRDKVLWAEQLERAGDPEAPTAYLEAARAEAASYHGERALRLVERGLAIAGSDADRFALTCLKGAVHGDLNDTAASIEAYQAALALASDEVERCRAAIGLAGALRVVDRHEEALALLGQAEAAASAEGLATERAQIHFLRGNLQFMLGDLADCRAQHEAALAAALEAGSRELEARALGGLADAFYAEGRLLTSLDYFRRCVALAEEEGLGRIAVANRSMIAITRINTGDLAGVAEDAEAAIDLARRVGHQRAEMIAEHALHFANEMRGAYDVARPHTEHSLALAQSLGSKRFEAEGLDFLGEIERGEGRQARALDLLHRALAICRETGMSYIGPVILGAIARTTDDADERDRVLREGEAMLAEGSLSHNHIFFYRDAIEAALRSGAWDDAERYAASLEAYIAAEPTPLSDVVIARARALAAVGRRRNDPAVVEELRAVRARLAEFGMKPAMEGIDAALSSV